MIKENDGEQFKKKREQFQISLRKTNRQQVLMKRRNIQQFDGPQKTSEIGQQKLLICDSNLSTFLKEILSTNFEMKDISTLLQQLNSNNIYDRHRGIIGLRKLSSDPTEKLLNALLCKNIIKKLTQMCDQNDYPQLRLQILWLYTNLSSFAKQASTQMVQSKIIPIVAESISHSDDNISYQAVWLCGNLAAQDIKYRNQLIQYNCVMKILKFVETSKKIFHIVTAVWALTNLVRGQPKPKYDSVKYVIATIAETLKRGIIKSEEVISDCLWSLANLSDGPKIRVQRLMEAGVAQTVMKYLSSQNLSILIPAIRIVGNFTTGTRQQTNQILKHNFLDAAYRLLLHKKMVIVKEVCWAISNVTAGTDEQILQFLQRTDIIYRLLEIYPTLLPEVKSEIIWIFTNLQRSDGPQIIFKVFETIGLMSMIGEILSQKNNKIVFDALICLEKVLVMGERMKKQQQDPNLLLKLFQKSGGVPILQSLQHNKSQKIYDECLRIMKRFFNLQQQPMEDV